MNIKAKVSESPVLKGLLIVFTLIMLVFYFKLFFTSGVRYDEIFLKKEKVSSETHYKGSCSSGKIEIIVQGIKNKEDSSAVIFKLPNNITEKYSVSFKDISNWDSGITSIKNKDGEIVFEGEYKKGDPFLLDKNENPIMDWDYTHTVNGKTAYDSDYKISLKSAADLAGFYNESYKGDFRYLFLAAVIFITVFIDIKFPLFFFTLHHFLDVKDPEPSDLYIMMQKISWIVLPLIGTILMITAIR